MDKWSKAYSKLDYTRSLMERRVEEYLTQENIRKTYKTNQDNRTKKSDFIDIIRRKKTSMTSPQFRARHLVQKWLDGELIDDFQNGTFLHEKVLIEIFSR